MFKVRNQPSETTGVVWNLLELVVVVSAHRNGMRSWMAACEGEALMT